jgi:hypothetical protein
MSSDRNSASTWARELVGLPRALGDHPQLFGVRQDDSLRKRFDQPDEPLVAGGGFHGHLKRPQFTEPAGDPVGLVAAERFPLGDDSPTTLLHHDAQADNLLVEVDADVLHGPAPFVETTETVVGRKSDNWNLTGLPRTSRTSQRGVTSALS